MHPIHLEHTPWLRRLVLALALCGPLAPGTGVAQDTPELHVRASITAVDGVVYFQPGELLVGAPTLPGRPALRPLRGDDSVELPQELDDYEELSAGCPEPEPTDEASGLVPRGDAGVLTRGDIGGDGRLEQVRVVRQSPTTPPRVQVIRDDVLVAEGTLPVPALPCRGLVAEAEPEAPPALLLVWTSRGAGHTVGVTVFELPEEEGEE